jgi:hypothetical protein
VGYSACGGPAVLILRIKQAECALADGRLDEAFELVMNGDIRSHRQGQGLAGQVARALAWRGRQHLLADRYGEADSDIQKAQRLGGNFPLAAELREALEQLRADQQRRSAQDAAALALARQRLEQGQISIGQEVLAEVRGGAADDLRAQAERDRALAEALGARVEQAIGSGCWELALETLAGAPAHLASRLREEGRKVARALSPQIREALRGGRLDLAQVMLGRLERCGAEAMELEDLRGFMRICVEARAEVERERWEAAEACVRRLARIVPDAAWVAEAGNQLRAAREAMQAVVAGPLGLMDGAEACSEKATKRRSDGATKGQAEGRSQSPGCTFVLSVDGAGSFLVVAKPRVTIGAISSSTACDVRLMADAQLPALTLTRSDEDYLLSCALPVGINDRLVLNKLLADGDKLAPSPRCRMTFRRPCPASATAALDLSGARLSRADVRRIILMSREIIIGPGPMTHVRCDQLERNIVLVQRHGRLICQGQEMIRIDGRSVAGPAEVGIGSRVEIGPVSLVIAKAG